MQTLNQDTLKSLQALLETEFKTIIEFFLADTSNFIVEMNDALAKQNYANIVRPAHTIKSSSSQLGAENLSDIAHQLEELLKENTEPEINEKHIASLLKKLTLEFEQLKPQINTFLRA